jgi:hypothetical protein
LIGEIIGLTTGEGAKTDTEESENKVDREDQTDDIDEYFEPVRDRRIGANGPGYRAQDDNPNQNY